VSPLEIELGTGGLRFRWGILPLCPNRERLRPERHGSGEGGDPLVTFGGLVLYLNLKSI